MTGSADRRLRVLHAIHDFLPRHRAGSEIYAFELCRALDRDHLVTVLAAEYDPARAHGHVTWRVQDGLPVVELVNNWRCRSFEETYRPPLITEQLGRLLDIVQPDVLHLHSLLNLSFDLPALARKRGIAVVATLHDYTLVCPSGGQRVHKADDHVCETIDPARCARCFLQSPFHAQIGVGAIVSSPGIGRLATHAASFLRRHVPGVASGLAQAAGRTAGIPVVESDIAQRLDRVRGVLDDIDVVVAPSRSIGDEFVRLGLGGPNLRVLDHGFVPMTTAPRTSADGPLRIGFVGTLVWHKGIHLLIDAVRALPPGSFELRIFGDPQVFPDYYADLVRRADGLAVRFMGEFERAEMIHAYAGLDLIVVPSLWPENSPLVIREAFMSGVPVVGARIGGIAELVTHDVSGILYEPRSTPQLTAALRLLVDDRERLQALMRGIPPVKSMAEHAREWADIYASVCR